MLTKEAPPRAVRASPPAAAPAGISRAALLALAGICGAASLLFGLYWTPIGPDDPWITYRYAENLAAGHGFVYNLGERVYGTSTPLYALLLATAALVGLPVPETSWAIGFVCLIASIVLLFLLVRRLHSELAGIAAAGLLASAYQFHRVFTFGMETPLYVVLIVGAFLAYANGRELLAAALAAACLLMRLDGAAVGAALLLAHLVTRREIPWRAGLLYLAIVAPWFVFSVAYFGSPLPNTMVAKRLHTLHTRLYWMPRWLLLEPRAWLSLVGVAVLLARPSLRGRSAAFALWAAMYVGAYSMVAMHRYDWYLTPLLPALAAFAGVGVVAVARRLVAAEPRRLAVSLAIAAVLIAPDGGRALKRLMGDEGVLGLERLRYEAAIWMRDNLPPGAPIATGGIGLVGYHTGRHLYDAMGLVTPGSMRIVGTVADPRLVPFPRFLPAVIEDYRPEYVFDGFRLAPDEDTPDFMRGQYEPVREWSRDPQSFRFILYRRITPRPGEQAQGR
jgi:hypothetical protein